MKFFCTTMLANFVLFRFDKMLPMMLNDDFAIIEINSVNFLLYMINP